MGMQFILPRDGAVTLALVVRLGYDRELLAAVGNSESLTSRASASGKGGSTSLTNDNRII